MKNNQSLNYKIQDIRSQSQLKYFKIFYNEIAES